VTNLQDAAMMLQRIQATTKGKPSPAAVGIRAWPTRKASALQEVQSACVASAQHFAQCTAHKRSNTALLMVNSMFSGFEFFNIFINLCIISTGGG
jgi:hypothetical protein